MPTRHGEPSACGPIARRSPPRFTRPWRSPRSRRIVATRSAAYSLPMPPKSISMPARGRRTDFAFHSTSAQPMCATAAASSASVGQRRRFALEVPDAAQHARRDVEEAARERVALVGVAQQRRGLGVDRHRRAACGGVDARRDAVVAVARILRLDAAHVRDRRLGRAPRDVHVGRRELDLVLRGHRAESLAELFHRGAGHPVSGARFWQTPNLRVRTSW